MYTYNYCKKIFTFYQKICNYMKKNFHHTIIKKNLFAKYKNGKAGAKFIIK